MIFNSTEIESVTRKKIITSKIVPGQSITGLRYDEIILTADELEYLLKNSEYGMHIVRHGKPPSFNSR